LLIWNEIDIKLNQICIWNTCTRISVRLLTLKIGVGVSKRYSNNNKYTDHLFLCSFHKKILSSFTVKMKKKKIVTCYFILKYKIFKKKYNCACFHLKLIKYKIYRYQAVKQKEQ